jgi:hypothetical protein
MRRFAVLLNNLVHPLPHVLPQSLITLSDFSQPIVQLAYQCPVECTTVEKNVLSAFCQNRPTGVAGPDDPPTSCLGVMNDTVANIFAEQSRFLLLESQFTLGQFSGKKTVRSFAGLPGHEPDERFDQQTIQCNYCKSGELLRGNRVHPPNEATPDAIFYDVNGF